MSVPHHPGRRELSLFGLSQAPTDSADDALREIGELDAIGSVSIGKRERVGIRLSDECISDLGEMLEAGDEEGMWAGGLVDDTQVVVDFCDPNATKALHVGHLRNIALGNAIAALFKAAGAAVTTQSQVGDVGRSVGEAMAGYEQYGEDESPFDRNQKTDHFVGSCYAEYVTEAVRTGAVADGLASDPALSREDELHDDLASDLIERWRSGDPNAVALWKRIRDWAVAGHEETLARLNVHMERMLFESDFLSDIDSAGDRLVETGLAEQTEGGAVLYFTGDSSYPQLVLRRPDGHSTQYLRYLGLWNATRSMLASGDSIQVLGDEWLSLANANDTLLGNLAPDEKVHPTQCLVHGMIAIEDQVVKSSLSAPWLIDDLLDEISEQVEIEFDAQEDAGLIEKLSGTVALGMFIGDPPEKRLSISKRALFDPSANPGWAIASAIVRAWDEENDGPPDPSVSDRDYRFLVAQSQVHRQLVRRSCQEVNPVHVARFLIHLCRWFLSAPCTPRLARAMRTVLASGLVSLGLPTPPGDRTASQPA
jgi:arginyl-tRNA synthetase